MLTPKDEVYDGIQEEYKKLRPFMLIATAQLLSVVVLYLLTIIKWW